MPLKVRKTKVYSGVWFKVLTLPEKKREVFINENTLLQTIYGFRQGKIKNASLER